MERQAGNSSRVFFISFSCLFLYSDNAVAYGIIYLDFLCCHSTSCMAVVDVYFSSAFSSPCHIPYQMCFAVQMLMLSWNVDLHLCIPPADEKAALVVTTEIICDVYNLWWKEMDGDYGKPIAFCRAAQCGMLCRAQSQQDWSFGTLWCD